MDGIHETSVRNPKQAEARTARGDANGSAEVIYCDDDIPDCYKPEDLKKDLEDKSKSDEEIYKKVQQKINTRTKIIRDYRNSIEKTRRNIIAHARYQARKNNIDEKNIEKMVALINRRTLSVQFRAKGVSEEKRVENYEREIRAYAEMYVAEFTVAVKNGKFNEVKWLKDHKYKDIAKTHFPFSEHEIEIFTTEAIKSHVIEADESAVAKAYGDTRGAYEKDRGNEGNNISK